MDVWCMIKDTEAPIAMARLLPAACGLESGIKRRKSDLRVPAATEFLLGRVASCNYVPDAM